MIQKAFKISKKILLFSMIISGIGQSSLKAQITEPTFVGQPKPINFNYNVQGSLIKNVTIKLSTIFKYANLKLSIGDQVILDNIDIPKRGQHTLKALVKFPKYGNSTIKVTSRGGNFTITSLTFTDNTTEFPEFTDISDAVNIPSGVGYKYAGPSVADFDNDGDYDLFLNNHNDEFTPSVLVTNNGNGTFSKNTFSYSKWKKQDLHGTALGDYDNDGDLDLISAVGGGNGTKASIPDFFKNEGGKFVLTPNDQVGLTTGHRGRTAVWGDFDNDNDLDLILFNAHWNNPDPNGGKNGAYKNLGNGQFEAYNVPNLKDAEGDRFVMTDLNRDGIDDFILFSPLSIWIGDGNFGFEDKTNQWVPSELKNTDLILAAAEADIDNDGDVDIYLSRGTPYRKLANKSFDYDAINQKFDLNGSGDFGKTFIEFRSAGDITLDGWSQLFRSTYKGDFPLFIGLNKQERTPSNDAEILNITKSQANGFPSDRSRNGVYLGYENGVWKLETVRDADIYWEIRLRVNNVYNIASFDGEANESLWATNNKNVQDYLLINTGKSFVNGTNSWNLPKGGNNWGVTTGDFNNDGFADFYINRYPFLKQRVADYMLLNNGNGQFDIATAHGASDTNNKSHGDMSQAFDFDLDGDVDILEGSDEFGRWHMFGNQKTDENNYSIVKVGYSPLENVDPISADVTIETTSATYYKRVGSAGSAHSQSLLNIVHFGLGTSSSIQKITVKWRNGETKVFNNPKVNNLLSTDEVKEVATVNCSTLGTLIPLSGDFELSINYSTSETREIWLALFNEDTNTWLGAGKANVNAGSGNTTIKITTQFDRTEGINYSLRASIRPLNTTWKQNLNSCKKTGVKAANDNVSCSGLSSLIPASGNFNVSIDYSTLESRDIVVALFNDDTNTWLGSGKTTVGKGIGTVKLNIATNVTRVTNTRYSLRAYIRPLNTTWKQNLNSCVKSDVKVSTARSARMGALSTREAISIVPNPSTNNITITSILEGRYTVNIYNILGVLKIQTTISKEENNINISNLLPGNYFVNIQKDDKKEQTVVLKLVKN